MNNGWIKLHRCLLDKPIWCCSTQEQKIILITILLLANHAEKEWEWKGRKFTCKSGQFITSLPSLAEKSGCSIQNVRTALKRFRDYGFLTDESTNAGRLITVVNWEKYQDKENDATGEPTGSQQAANRRLTPNKNDKNDKNDKIFSPESIEYKLAAYLLHKIQERVPAFKEPDIQKWADQIRLLIQRDKREPQEIVRVIEWAQNNDFWSANILSTSSLRKRYDQLNAKRLNELKQTQTPKAPPPNIGKII